MNQAKSLAKEGKIDENASIKDLHSIIINASIEDIWMKLADLQSWPDWNNEISSVEGPGSLSEGVGFSWTYKTSKINSEVQLFKAPNELAWVNKSYWAKEIYVWSLETDENQTIVTLKTSLQGPFTFFTNSHQKVYNKLIEWLQDLKRVFEEEN